MTQRTTEFGVRMALGADRGAILRDVLFRGARLAAVGTALGLLVAAGVARFLRVVLLGVNPFDPVTYLTLALALAGVCLLVRSCLEGDVRRSGGGAPREHVGRAF